MAEVIVELACENGDKKRMADGTPMSGFKISRNISGERIEIELTSSELREAYDCKEAEYFYSDIEMTLEEFDGDDSVLFGYSAEEIAKNDELMTKIVDEYTLNRNKYNMAWHAAAVDAFRSILRRLKNGTLH